MCLAQRIYCYSTTLHRCNHSSSWECHNLIFCPWKTHRCIKIHPPGSPCYWFSKSIYQSRINPLLAGHPLVSACLFQQACRIFSCPRTCSHQNRYNYLSHGDDLSWKSLPLGFHLHIWIYPFHGIYPSTNCHHNSSHLGIIVNLFLIFNYYRILLYKSIYYYISLFLLHTSPLIPFWNTLCNNDHLCMKKSLILFAHHSEIPPCTRNHSSTCTFLFHASTHWRNLQHSWFHFSIWMFPSLNICCYASHPGKPLHLYDWITQTH